MAPTITIYTDGSALGNPGKGGYGVVLISGPHRKELSQGYRLTTNNRMELMAVCVALEALKIEGIDAFMIGPCDLAGSIGRVNDIYCPEVLGMIDTIVAKCRAAGKPVGIAVGSLTENDLEFWRDRGFNFMSSAGDMSMMFGASKLHYETLRRVFGESKE